jgi:hypothetical protein
MVDVEHEWVLDWHACTIQEEVRCEVQTIYGSYMPVIRALLYSTYPLSS